MQGYEAIQMYKEFAQQVKATESYPLRLGNVEFWIEGDALIFSIPASQWDGKAIGKDVARLVPSLPSFGAIVARHAERAWRM
jgi:hypothetical protein